MVPLDGLEPSLPKKMDFESIVSTNSTTAALSSISKTLQIFARFLHVNFYKLTF